MRTLSSRKWAFAVLLACIGILISNTARSEFYVAGQGGVSFPGSFSHIEGIGPGFGGSGYKSSNLNLATSPLYGAKVGYFLPRLNWLGFEGEYFYTNPHIEQQPFSVTTPSGQTFNRIGEKPRAHTSMSVAALNVIVRYPGKRFQPYIGIGPAMYWASISGSEIILLNGKPLSASDSSLGFNALVGSRFFLTKQLAIFAEYKYNKASFTFEGNAQFKADYSANNIVAGLSVHF